MLQDGSVSSEARGDGMAAEPCVCMMGIEREKYWRHAAAYGMKQLMLFSCHPLLWSCPCALVNCLQTSSGFQSCYLPKHLASRHYLSS